MSFPLGVNDFSLLRMCALGLVEATKQPDPGEVVRSLLAMQGQQVSAVPHAILARMSGSAITSNGWAATMNAGHTPAQVSDGAATVSAVWKAFEQRSIVRSWPMRGTVHISTREDHHWLRAALAHRYGASTVSDRDLERSAEIAFEVIGRTGEASRAELRVAWEEEGLLDPSSEDFQHRWRALLMRLHIEGCGVGGRRSGREHLIVDARDLPDADSSPVGAGVAFGQPRHDEAITQIAARYAWGHGPVCAADLARWTGLSLGVSARALRQAVENSSTPPSGRPVTGMGPLVWVRAIDEGAGEIGVELCDPPKGTTRSAGGLGMHGFFAMRSDLLDILAQNRTHAEGLHYLPSFDELHVGYKTRLSLTDAAGEKLICPTNNGLFRPLCVKGGRVIAVNPVNKGLLWADGVDLNPRLEQEVCAAIAQTQAALAEETPA